MSSDLRILVTGAAGMLGRDLCQILAEDGHTVIPTSARPQEDTLGLMDVTDVKSVRVALAEVQPDLVMHCAAWTDVDGCERDPEKAYRVNAMGTWAVAAAAEEIGAGVIAVSTDFVFDGAKTTPYTEFDPTNPISVYGASKLAGETLALRHCSRCWIARTSWLYGLHGKSFPRTILTQAASRDELFVVEDQVGSPTYTGDLAVALAEFVKTPPLPGVYHLANAGGVSRSGLAETILARVGMDHVRVSGITSDEAMQRFHLAAPRPKYSVLRSAALMGQEMAILRPWQYALDEYLSRL